MNINVFSTKPYDQRFLDAANERHGHQLTYFEPRLAEQTVRLAEGAEAVCAFVNDQLSATVVEGLAELGIQAIALRCAGYNNVDLQACEQHGIKVVRVPAYSPHGVAEHAVALMLAANRKIHRAHQRVREANFALEGLLGFEMHGSTVGIIGTGKIGTCVARIMAGFGCELIGYELIGYDKDPSDTPRELGLEYVDLPDLFERSDIITLHAPLTPETHHMIDADAIAKMKHGVMIINTSRGKLIDTKAVIDAMKTGKIGSLGLDVYEEEADLFFENLSEQVIQDDVFARLMTFPNAIITAHQAFLTDTALSNIADTTLSNLKRIEAGESCPNELSA